MAINFEYPVILSTEQRTLYTRMPNTASYNPPASHSQGMTKSISVQDLNSKKKKEVNFELPQTGEKYEVKFEKKPQPAILGDPKKNQHLKPALKTESKIEKSSKTSEELKETKNKGKKSMKQEA